METPVAGAFCFNVMKCKGSFPADDHNPRLLSLYRLFPQLGNPDFSQKNFLDIGQLDDV
jgi:hypothetical protein